MTIITPSDVEKLSGEDFDDDTYTLADALIPMVQGELEAYLGRAVEPAYFTGETHLLPIDRSYVYLRNTPVISVQRITVNGFPLQPTWYFVQPMGITLYGNAWGFGYGFAPVGANVAAWLSPAATFVIDYAGGLNTASDPKYQALRNVMIKTVLREITIAREGDTARGGYMSMKVEDFNWRKSEAVVDMEAGAIKGGGDQTIANGMFTPVEMAILNRFKRRTASS